MNEEIMVQVAAPIDRVWDVMSDAERWHEWTASVRGIKRLDDGPLRPGSRALVRQPKFPPAMWRVTHVESEDPRQRSFSWESGVPGYRVVATHSVIETAGGMSMVTLSIRSSGPIARLFDRIWLGITRRYLAMEAEGLKARVEGRR